LGGKGLTGLMLGKKKVQRTLEIALKGPQRKMNAKNPIYQGGGMQQSEEERKEKKWEKGSGASGYPSQRVEGRGKVQEVGKEKLKLAMGIMKHWGQTWQSRLTAAGETNRTVMREL